MESRNHFQELMKRWSMLGAYNALHTIRLSEPADAARWSRAAAPSFAGLGFPPPSIGTIYAGLDDGVLAEINRPFSTGETPLRLFLTHDGAGGHYFGVTFEHWVADSQSIRMMLQRIFAEYTQPGSASELPPLTVCDKPFGGLFCDTKWSSVIVESMRTYARHLHSYRPPVFDPLDHTTGFQVLHFPDGLIDHIRALGKKLGATVNDIFLAVVAQTMDHYTAGDRASMHPGLFRPRRDKIGFSLAMNIRPLATEPLDHAFGLFLSYYTVLLKNPETQSLSDLAMHIAAGTRTMKSRRNALRFFHGFKLANLIWDYHTQPWRRAMMSHKFAPILGGISSVNLTDTWIGKEPRVLDYIRAATTGPHVPVLFLPNTIGNRLSIGILNRLSIYSNQRAREIAGELVHRLKNL